MVTRKLSMQWHGLMMANGSLLQVRIRQYECGMRLQENMYSPIAVILDRYLPSHGHQMGSISPLAAVIRRFRCGMLPQENAFSLILVILKIGMPPFLR